MNHYAVVDSAQRPHFNERLAGFGARYCSLFDGQAESNLKDITPLLVEYAKDGTGSELSGEIERLGVARPAVSLVASHLPLQDLALHFRAFHLIKVPQKGRREMLLRWYDTRILPVWLDLLTTAQRKAFLAGIHQWQYFDRFGDLKEWVIPAMPGEKLPALPPLRLDQDQYARLLDASEPDVAIAQLRRIMPDEMRRVPFRDLFPFISMHLADSRAHGVQQLDDQVQYLLLALYTSGGFRNHPVVTARLAAHCDRSLEPFGEWVMALPEGVGCLFHQSGKECHDVNHRKSLSIISVRK